MKFLSSVWNYFRGYRTLGLAALVVFEPVLEAALTSGEINFATLARQAVIALMIAWMRQQTSTPIGRKE